MTGEKTLPTSAGVSASRGRPHEKELLERLRRGDEQAFELLVRSHHRALLAVARPIVGDEADEVVQNAWIKAHRALPDFEGRSGLRTWLTRIVVNEARMLLRKRGREVSLEDTEGGQGGFEERFGGMMGQWTLPPRFWQADSPDDLLTSDQLLECLQLLLEEMPSNQSALMEMRDVGGLKFEEICNELDISASNARVLLHRARSRLFDLVDHYQETGEC